MFKSKNTFLIGGKTTVIVDSKGCKIKIDTEDLNRVKDFTWNYNIQRTTNYVLNAKTGKSIHRVIMSCTDDLCVDHINGDTLDNRKCNLRICTKAENSYNHCVPKNSPLGVTGVTKRRGKYLARITVKGVTYHLGFYSTFEEAIKVRKEAEEKYFGEYRRKD